jgi:hypothetical protein
MKFSSTLLYTAALFSAISLAEPIPQPDQTVEERTNPTPSVLGTPKVVGEHCTYQQRLDGMKTCEKDGNWIVRTAPALISFFQNFLTLLCSCCVSCMVTMISGCPIKTALRARSAGSQNARMLREETCNEYYGGSSNSGRLCFWVQQMGGMDDSICFVLDLR